LTVTAQSDRPEDTAKRRVVMIRGTLEGETSVGAGVITGWENGRVYIFTANHVIRNHLGKLAETITVEFRDLKGETVTATPLRDWDPDRDLAMLAVEATRLPEDLLNALPTLTLGDLTTLQFGEPVYAIGYKDSEPWSVVGLSEFSKLDLDNVNFQSSGIDVGASGGGLFDENWELIGMVSRTNGSEAKAVRIDRIIELLKQWRYPVESAKAGGTYPCEAVAVGSSGAASLLNQVRTLPLSKASLASPVRGGSTVSVMEKRSEGGEVWYGITYSYNDENHSGWLLGRYLSLAETCPK
jgi:Trypsin-like peptidase domain